MRNPNPEHLIPLSPIHYQILLALIDGPSYGYGLRESIRRDSDGIMTLSTSTVYLALKSMVRYRYVEVAGSEVGVGSPNARTLYQITTTGRFVLEQETDRLRAVVKLATRRLKPAA